MAFASPGTAVGAGEGVGAASLDGAADFAESTAEAERREAKEGSDFGREGRNPGSKYTFPPVISSSGGGTSS